jgi:hypothetical protein
VRGSREHPFTSEQQLRDDIRKRLMKFLAVMKKDPVLDDWSSGYYIAEKFAERIGASCSSSFTSFIATILHEQAVNGKLEVREDGVRSANAAWRYRLPGILDQLAQL